MQPVGDARTVRAIPAQATPVAAMGLPVAMAPGQMGMGMNGMEMIRALPRLQVKEKANILQEVTAMPGTEIEMANKYDILDDASNRLFYAVEETNCCKRQLQNGCCHDCAPYDVNILYTPPGMLNQKFVRMSRPFQCTCCCINRPVAQVTDETTGTKIGSFRDPCTCCCLKFQVQDENNNDVLEVDGGCCCTQPGMVCPLPCGPCRTVSFDVKDSQSGQVVANVEKQVPSCLTFLFAPDVDNYKVEFNQVQNPTWKAILLAFTIFLDYRYFNTNRNEDAARQGMLAQQ